MNEPQPLTISEVLGLMIAIEADRALYFLVKSDMEKVGGITVGTVKTFQLFNTTFPVMLNRMIKM